MERKSVFPRCLCEIKHVTSSVYVIKRVRVLTFAGQSIDHDGVVDKLKKLMFDKINHQFKNLQTLS